MRSSPWHTEDTPRTAADTASGAKVGQLPSTSLRPATKPATQATRGPSQQGHSRPLLQRWAELKAWLQTEAKDVCDIFVLQETHWQASAEFTTSGWCCVSSASAYVAIDAVVGAGGPAHTVPLEGARPTKHKKAPRKRQSGSKEPSTTRADGVMVLVSPEVSANTIRWKEHVQGRVLEVRFDWDGARTTVLAVYQHAWSPAKTVHANKTDRASVLKALARCVKQVPARDTLVIAVDFNSSVSSLPRLVGPRVLPPQEARPDEAEVTNFVRTHQLTVLNTLQVRSPHTFEQGDCTQIDFLLTTVPASRWGAGRRAGTCLSLRG